MDVQLLHLFSFSFPHRPYINVRDEEEGKDEESSKRQKPSFHSFSFCDAFSNYMHGAQVAGHVLGSTSLAP